MVGEKDREWWLSRSLKQLVGVSVSVHEEEEEEDHDYQ